MRDLPAPVSCVRLRGEHRDHVWSYDFVHCRTDEGRASRTLYILDESTRECLAIRIRRKLNSLDVIDVLTDLFILRGIPAYTGSDNGPELVAQAVRDWIGAVGAKTAFIEPGSPWENGYCESFNGRLRDELLSGETFNSSRVDLLRKSGEHQLKQEVFDGTRNQVYDGVQAGGGAPGVDQRPVTG